MSDSTEIARRVPKPWGHELIWALTDRYCGKVIAIDASTPEIDDVERLEDDYGREGTSAP